MALKRVTMQDIADACGLSRNTVSKIFNNRGSVPEATRRTVLAAAQELGYHHRPVETAAEAEAVKGSVALLTQHKLLSHNFGVYFITSFTDQLSRAGYTIKLYEVSPRELAEKKLPPHFSPTETAGILGIELFDRGYLEMICSLKLPTVFVDGYAQAAKALMCCDFISMENIASEIALVRHMIGVGAKRIGFVGDPQHCNSFHERWLGYCAALGEAGLPVETALCILERDSKDYADALWLRRRLHAMPALPDAFACANDFLAIHLITALKKEGLSIPQDVMVTGFDGSLETAVISPALTTAQIPSVEIGHLASSLLLDRIQTPDLPFRWTYVKTTPIFSESTR